MLTNRIRNNMKKTYTRRNVCLMFLSIVHVNNIILTICLLAIAVSFNKYNTIQNILYLIIDCMYYYLSIRFSFRKITFGKKNHESALCLLNDSAHTGRFSFKATLHIHNINWILCGWKVAPNNRNGIWLTGEWSV